MTNVFRETYRSFETTKLIAIANSKEDEYRKEAIQAAREELDSRGENWQDPDLISEAQTNEALTYDRPIYIQINGTDHRLASLGSRLLGQILDGIFAFVIGTIASLILLLLKTEPWIIFIIYIAIVYLYLLFSDGLKGGQSLAKRILKLAVIDTNTGTPCKYWQSFVRNFIQILGIIDWAFMFGKKRQRLGDKAARTVVVTFSHG